MVRALDANGSVDLTFTGSISVSITSGTGTLSGTTTVNAIAGVATFAGLTLTGSSGNNTLFFSSPGLASAASSTVGLTVSAGVTASAGVAATITYEGNNSTGGSVPNLITGSGIVTLATNSGILVRSGHIFGGWNTAADGSGTTYAAGSFFTLSVNITLYSLWIQLTPTVAPTLPTVEVEIHKADPATSNSFGEKNRIVTSISNSGSGTVVIVDGKIVYTPSPSFKGIDTYRYTYLDATGVSKVVSVQVTVPNQAPKVNPETNPLKIGNSITVNLNVVDPNGDRFRIELGKPTKDVSVLLIDNAIKFLVPDDFSGKISVPVTVVDEDGAATLTSTELVVNPDPISSGKLTVFAPLKKIALNEIVPLQQKISMELPVNATGFELYVNGKFVSSGKSNEMVLQKIVGPRDRVEVVSLGNNDTKSGPTLVMVSRNPISIGNVNFASGSDKLTSESMRLLDNVITAIIQHGFTIIDLTGFVDSVGSKIAGTKLSIARAETVKKYMAIQLVGRGVRINSYGSADSNAVGRNDTDSGRALNRRVEIKVN